MGKGKKPQIPVAVSTDEEDESDLSMSEEEAKTAPPPAKPKAKKTVKKAAKAASSSDSDSEEEVAKSAPAKKPGFALLMGDDSDSEESEEEEEAPVVVEKKPAKKEVLPEKAEGGGKKSKKKKKKKKDNDSDDDLDAMLAELQLEYAGEKPAGGALKNEATPEVAKGKKKKKDTGGETEVNDEEDDDNNDDPSGTVKTAAQKRKEKKERQKQKLANQKKNEKKGDAKTLDSEKAKSPSVEPTADDLTVTKEGKPEDAEGPEGEEEEEGATDKKSKKKKKKGGEKEEEKKKGKKPGKGTLAAMQEALKQVQEEEAKRKQEEEEKFRREEEAEAERLEKLRLETEKKEAKKLRDKEKREQLKKEGKYLTAKQKAEKARAEAMLAAMREKGMEVPVVGEKKGPRPGTRIRTKKNKNPVAVEEEKTAEELPKVEVEVKAVEEPPKDTVKAAWDDDDEEEEVKDSWDADDDEEDEEGEKSSKDASPLKEDEEEESSSEEESSDDESESEESETETEDRHERALQRIAKRRTENEKNRSVDVLRAPVVCVLGHVDTGKTKILDKLRRTNVQDGEAGGITQQIGATNVPIEVIKEQCKMVKDFSSNLKVPGLLIIDTPGHESFSNLRDRGSSLCDIAILVVDIMHNLEPQTIESLNLLRKKKTPFIIALNKIDRLYEWKANRHKDVKEVISSQNHNTKLEFEKRAQEVITAIAEQGLNAALFYDNPDPKTYISMVPTSAHSGDGMGNLMALLVQLSQKMLAQRLSFSEELQATVLEVKAIAGLGHTIDIVLVNGTLKEGQTMIVAGTEGPIVTPIKALLTPSKMQDLRVKSTYVEHKVLRAAQGVKIAAKELDKAIAGLNLLVANNPDEVEICKQEMEKRLESALNAIKLKERGVFVQASTLGSLEALLEFLKVSKIPFAGVKIGPVVRKDVMKASVMLEHEEKYTIILAFDVKVERDAQEMADNVGVKIFQADIIYHLFDRFNEYQEDLKKKKREEHKHLAIFPCKLRVIPNFVFNSRDPIVAGVTVEAGIVRQGTPLCVPSKDFLEVGIVTSIECNHKEVETARKGDEICIKIEPIPGDSPKMFGRHFDETDLLTSKISRASIDTCKNYFRDDLIKSDWALMVELKKIFEIM